MQKTFSFEVRRKIDGIIPTQRQTAAEGRRRRRAAEGREEAAAALFLKFRVQNDGTAG